MRTASARTSVALEPAAALRLWADTNRWPTFVEGFARVLELSPGWPAEGERVIWESNPSGRGRVTEKVVENGPDRLATMVFEEALMGRQMIQAVPAESGSEVQLSLEYRITKWGPFGTVADVLFIRRRQEDALARTLRRFAVEAEEEAGLR